MERRFRITVDGTPYDVTVEDLTDTGNLLYPQPGSMAVPSVPSTAPAPAAPPVAVAGSGDIVATLGGVVESVLVQAGQVVAQGDTVIVLEAMKMKSPMVAHRSGRVVVVAVKAGDRVEAGQVLVALG